MLIYVRISSLVSSNTYLYHFPKVYFLNVFFSDYNYSVAIKRIDVVFFAAIYGIMYVLLIII